MSLMGAKEMNLIVPPTSMSEDCLYLNIYTPAHAREGSNLPVSVRLCQLGERMFLSLEDWKGKSNSELPCSLDPD